MKSEQEQDRPAPERKQCADAHCRASDYAWVLAATVTISLLAITRDSLWIDEGWTVWAASQPTLHSLVDEVFLKSDNSISQTPLHNLYLWAWIRAFGSSEPALRASNIPFVFILLLTIQTASKALWKWKWGWAIAGGGPFLWFYVNDARPYVAVMALASLAVVSLLLCLREPLSSHGPKPWLCLLATLLLWGVHMLGAFLIPSLVAASLYYNRAHRERWRSFLKQWRLPVLVFLLPFCSLGAFYTWTLLEGKAGSIETPSLLNLGFSACEFLGFPGLAPPRNVLRESLNTEILLRYSATLMTGILCWSLVLAAILSRIKKSQKLDSATVLSAMLIVGILLFHAVALCFDFRYWGRHLAEFYPIFLLVLVTLLAKAPEKEDTWSIRRAALAFLLATWFLSSMRLAFSDEYRKDDYRSAVACAIQAAGDDGAILWAGDPRAARYYGLHFTNGPDIAGRPVSRKACLVSEWNAAQLNSASGDRRSPVIVVVGKPDLYDPNHSIASWLAEEKAELIATPNTFQIYTLPHGARKAHSNEAPVSSKKNDGETHDSYSI